MCIEVAGNKALTSHSIPKLPAAKASGSRQHKERKRRPYKTASMLHPLEEFDHTHTIQMCACSCNEQNGQRSNHFLCSRYTM